MGILKKLFTAKKEPIYFEPDPHKTEYENWLDFLELGGTSEEWDNLISSGPIKYKADSADVFQRYLKELTPHSDKYYELLQKIEKEWSALYNSKNYTSSLANIIELDCKEAILCYKKMYIINKKYGEKTPENIPPYKRLAMLYERQGRYEEAIEVCKEACAFGMDESGRINKIIKKM